MKYPAYSGLIHETNIEVFQAVGWSEGIMTEHYSLGRHFIIRVSSLVYLFVAIMKSFSDVGITLCSMHHGSSKMVKFQRPIMIPSWAESRVSITESRTWDSSMVSIHE